MPIRLARALVAGAYLLVAACQTAPTGEPNAVFPAVVRASEQTLFATDRSGVPTAGRCGDLPQVAVAAVAEKIDCIGLVDNTLNFPRGVIAWGDNILVADKGSNLQERAQGISAGRIVRYQPSAQGYARSTLLDGLDNPSGLSRGQHKADNHKVYISTPSAILRLTPDAPDPEFLLETVISDLPLSGWHYLSAVHATPEYLYVTVPSATDHCEQSPAAQLSPLPFPCPEESATTQPATAVVRRYDIYDDGGISQSFELVARGLRDALAVLETPSGDALLAADNGWDNINTTNRQTDPSQIPLDELNVVPLDKNGETPVAPHYGWPYCYQQDVQQIAVTPGYEHALDDCTAYEPAEQSLPAHSAPLGLIYHGELLLINLHGYAKGGRRTLAWSIDQSGLPKGRPQLFVDWDYRDVLGYLGGRPFGLASYGQHLLITDDWNQTLLLVRLRDKKVRLSEP